MVVAGIHVRARLYETTMTLNYIYCIYHTRTPRVQYIRVPHLIKMYICSKPADRYILRSLRRYENSFELAEYLSNIISSTHVRTSNTILKHAIGRAPSIN